MRGSAVALWGVEVRKWQLLSEWRGRSPALSYTSSHHDVSILIPPPVTSSFYCPFLRWFFFSLLCITVIFSIILLSIYKDRWGAEKMKEPPANTHTSTFGSLLAQILKYITSMLLSFWRSLHHVCVCVCVCPSSPKLLLSDHFFLDEYSVISFREYCRVTAHFLPL